MVAGRVTQGKVQGALPNRGNAGVPAKRSCQAERSDVANGPLHVGPVNSKLTKRVIFFF